MNSIAKSVCFLLLSVLVYTRAAAQDFEFHPPPSPADPATPAAMRDLAGRVLPVYQEREPERYLRNLSSLQLVAGEYGAAEGTRRQLRDRRRSPAPARFTAPTVALDMYSRAKAEASDRLPFAQAFARVYKSVVPNLSDADAYALTTLLAAPLSAAQEPVQRIFNQRRSKGSLTLGEAVDLISAYVVFDAYRSFAPLVAALNAEDDRRRYTADERILITTKDGVTLSAMLVRPKSINQPLPALLEFAIDPGVNYAKECAAHGYVGIIAYARGTGGVGARAVPFQHDGDDARAVIAWIIKQSWSDGRVGMYGSGYSGFAAWAAAKRLPAALKAIATSDAMAPGVDFPMAGNVFHNSAYRWAFRYTKPGETDQAIANDDAAWRAVDQAWYASGKRYRDLSGPSGKRVPIFTRWLNHPSYDRYWQKMVPFREQFAKIDIPVLSMTGYFAAGAAGALYYFDQHTRFNERANHTLLIGPYDDYAIRRVPAGTLQGLAVDPAAQLNLRELRFEWFDAVFKGAKVPALLQDRVNYQVSGTGDWRHAASLAALAKNPLKYYLASAAAKSGLRLSAQEPAQGVVLTQTLSFADRSDAALAPPAEIVSKTLVTRNALVFASDPLQKPLELGGLVSGGLELRVNKMDLDLNIALYELQSNGDYIKLFEPAIEFRASYTRDRVHRHLLQAGVRQLINFRSERMLARRLQAGSRIVLVLGITKRPDREINYGQGDDVSEESIEDARVPFRIRWYGGSYVELPVLR